MGSETSGKFSDFTGSFDRPGFAAAMRVELEQIAIDPALQKSPMLIKLLRYLVEETLAGRGDRIKAYSIAVDGLGRPADFDSQGDSYPRVQVGRVRKALATFYAQHAPKGELCLYLQQGSYQARLGRSSVAYPELFRPLSAAVTEPQQSEKLTHGAISAGIARTWPLKWILSLVAASVLLLFAGAIAFLALRQAPNESASTEGLGVTAKESTGDSPIVVLSQVSGRSDPKTANLAKAIFAILADGLGHSWIARVQTETEDKGKNQTPATADTYRLDTQLTNNGDDGYTFFARLFDVQSGIMIWSTSKSVTPREQDLPNDLGALIFQINGPYGAIAARETERLKHSFSPGYPCILQFLKFFAGRDPGLKVKVGQCLEQPVSNARIDATRLAARSTFVLSARNVETDREAAAQSALVFAREALEIDNQAPYAHFAMARASFVAHDCETGRRDASLATKASPYDPIILSILGRLSALCNQPEGNAMLEQAYRHYVPGTPLVRLSLIMAQIEQGRNDRLSKLGGDLEPSFESGLAYDYLCETLINAALDKREIASANWAKFVEASPAPGRSNDEMLYPIIVSDTARAHVLQFLEKKQIVNGKFNSGRS